MAKREPRNYGLPDYSIIFDRSRDDRLRGGRLSRAMKPSELIAGLAVRLPRDVLFHREREANIREDGHYG